ncbi:hypothetical protein DAI22_02g262100 [Oryza sativa Japonica Group]|nr:hypothetical protein DAI22_02g262100 [Oryza sativa Japonica Group]
MHRNKINWYSLLICAVSDAFSVFYISGIHFRFPSAINQSLCFTVLHYRSCAFHEVCSHNASGMPDVNLA